MYYTASNWMGARQIQVLDSRNVWPKPARLHNLGTADESWAPVQLRNLLNSAGRSDVSLRPGDVFLAELLNYFFSSLASAMLAWCPALETAFTNASALSGVDTRPERMFPNIMCLP